MSTASRHHATSGALTVTHVGPLPLARRNTLKEPRLIDARTVSNYLRTTRREGGAWCRSAALSYSYRCSSRARRYERVQALIESRW